MLKSDSLLPARRRGRPLGAKSRPKPAPAIPVPSLMPAALRVDAAAAYISVSKSYMKRLISRGQVRSVAIGRTRLVLTASLDELLTDGL